MNPTALAALGSTLAMATAAIEAVVRPQRVYCATASAAPEALARLDAELSSKSRSMISITIEIYDESNAHTLSATFEWFIQREKRT
jgi:hypothetical protein